MPIFMIEAKKLSEHCLYDILIDIEDGKMPLFGLIYSFAHKINKLLSSNILKNNFLKVLFTSPYQQQLHLSFLSTRKQETFDSAWIIVDLMWLLRKITILYLLLLIF